MHQIHREIHDYNRLRTLALYVLATALDHLRSLQEKKAH